MKIHCGQMVEGALKAALEAEGTATMQTSSPAPTLSPTLHDALATAGKRSGKIKIVPLGS